MRSSKLILLLALALLGAACNRDPKVQRQKHLENGNRYFNNNKFKEASIMYRRALQQDQRFGEAYYRLGLSELKLGHPVESLRALQRAVELDPNNQDAPAKLAELFLAFYSANPKHPAEYLKEIEDNTNKILARNPKSYDGLRLRGYLNLTKRNIQAATADFAAANEIKPGQPDLILVLCQSLLASQKMEEAEKLARATLDKEKGYAPLYDLLYGTYVQTKRYDDGEAILKLKSGNNPRNPLYILQLAAHYLAAQKMPEMQSQLDRITANPKDFPNGRALVGDFYFRSRSLDKAIEQYTLGMNESKSSDDKLALQKRQVEVLVAQGKVAEASKVVTEILQARPKDDDGIAMRGALALRSGTKETIQAAINDLQSVVSRTPNNHVLRFNYARALIAKGELDQAKVQLLESVKLRPDYVPARLALAQVYVTKGDFPNAQQMANEILQYDPNNQPAKLLRSSAMIGLRQYVEARRELKGLLDGNPQLTDAQFQLGMVNFSEGKFKEAEGIFRRLYESAPKDPRGLLGTIEALARQNQYPEAIKLITAELAKTPDRNELRLALANTAFIARNYDLAIQELQKLMAKDPKNTNYMLRLGECYRQKGNLEQAIAIVQKAQAAVPNDPVTTLQLALLYDTTGAADRSRPHYEKVLAIEPDNPMALNNLAYIMAEQGTNLDQALTMVQKAKQKLPTNPEISDTMGWIYIKKNLSDNAISILREITTKYPERAVYQYHLGMAYFQKGDKPQAKKILLAALTKKPDKGEEGKIKELIAKCN